jgi:trk system potassium uptake protein TrkA
MRIVILGAGQVGSTLAEHMSCESNDITFVDTNSGRLRSLQDRLDIRTVEGYASFPSVLAQAGCADAHMLVAVTNSDEVNMVACQVAQALFKVPRKVARIRGASYLQASESLFQGNSIPVDVLINPGQLVTDQIEQLTRWAGALQIHNFVDDQVKLAVFNIKSNSAVCGCQLDELNRMVSIADVRLVALYRGEDHIPIQGDIEFLAGDEAYMIATPAHLEAVRQLFVGGREPYCNIMIAGGGNIGASLAIRLEDSFNVKIIEMHPERCREIAELLSSAVVINGSASDLDILIQWGIEQVDLFCALTNDDEANIMASMLAKRAGAQHVLAIINNPGYVGLVDSGIVDYAVSPEQITIGSLLAYTRKGDVTRAYSLRKGQGEALETIVHGDRASSNIVGREIRELNLPHDVQIAAVVRSNKLFVPDAGTRIASEDHLIFFLNSKRNLKQVEKLLQFGTNYF